MTKQFSWIPVTEDVEADAGVQAAYDALRREDGAVHNLYRAFAHFPAPVVAADQFYRDVMHTPDAPLPMWQAELLSVDVAILNGCPYAETHHGANFIHLYGDAAAAGRMVDALKRGDLKAAEFDDRTRHLLEFGRKLTLSPEAMESSDIEALRLAGLNDAEISQAVQVTASFAYWTRFINAMGIDIAGEKIGKYG